MQLKYVIDASVAIKTVIAEPDSAKAIQLRDDYTNSVHDLIAPDLYPTEICNVLMMAERTAKIRPGEAAVFLSDIILDLPALFDAVPILPRALSGVEIRSRRPLPSGFAKNETSTAPATPLPLVVIVPPERGGCCQHPLIQARCAG